MKVSQRLTFLMCKYSISLYLGELLTGLSWTKCWCISLQRGLSSSLMSLCVAAPGEPIALIWANPSHVKALCCSLSLWQLDTHAAWGHACGAKFKLTGGAFNSFLTTPRTPRKTELNQKQERKRERKKKQLTMDTISHGKPGAYKNQAGQSAVATRPWLDSNGIIWCSIIWSWGAETQSACLFFLHFLRVPSCTFSRFIFVIFVGFI